MVDAIGELGRYTGSAVAIIQVAQARDVLVVLRESAHGERAGGRAIGIGQGFESVTGGKHFDGRVGIGGSGVAVACINRKAINGPADERHGCSFVEFGHQTLRNAVVVVSATGLHMRVVHVGSKPERSLPERFHGPDANRGSPWATGVA